MDASSFKDSMSVATDLLSHRGPDDAGFFFNDEHGVGMGHRRLSIIDLSDAGHQPMQSKNGDTVIVYNGEIYNFKTIRRQLQEVGHQFTSNSDTEVILKAYKQWGTICLDRFVGMFVFAIWDIKDQKLFIARDRLGIKPLYYFFDGNTLIFGSELKALMAFSRFKRNVDPDTFQLYLHYQYVPAPRTIFKNTFKLEAGHYLIFDGKYLVQKRWWKLPGSDLDTSVSNRLTENEALYQLDELLTQAVSDRLISDVPLGALLSGGIDSSVVVALMQKVKRSPVKTFSIGFVEKGYNEAPWARKIASHLGTDHTELFVSPQDALQVIPQLPEIYDEPFADSSSIPTFLVSKLTREKVTVALSGDGGDEQFAGYVRYWMTDTMSKWMNQLPRNLRAFARRFLEKIPVPILARYYSYIRNHLPQRLQVENFPDKWSKIVSQLSESELAELYRMTICIWSRQDIQSMTGLDVPRSTFEGIFTGNVHLTSIQLTMLVDQHTYLPDAMLTKVDRASMAASLEVRVPLLDHRVIAYTAQLPVHLKYRNGRGKYLLCKLLTRYVPRELIDRPKMGFGVPIAKWLKNELKVMLQDYLSHAHLQREGRLDPAMVKQVVDEHMSGINNHQHRLWALLMWEMWRERWL
jgi:asparagine synthase (glutamine-hydrolysing)